MTEETKMENELFCTERSCPFENCEKHWKHLIGRLDGQEVRVINLSGVCRDYLGGVLGEVEQTR